MMQQQHGLSPLKRAKTIVSVLKPNSRHHQTEARENSSPSLMLAIPGCCAWDEIGALLAGVFWGVLQDQSKSVRSSFWGQWNRGATKKERKHTERSGNPLSYFWSVPTCWATDENNSLDLVNCCVLGKREGGCCCWWSGWNEVARNVGLMKVEWGKGFLVFWFFDNYCLCFLWMRIIITVDFWWEGFSSVELS